jgi:nucleoside-diphosphate-sugar epimerase
MSELDLVVGTGPIGLLVARELIARGRRVRAVNRSGRRPPTLPSEVEVVAGDVLDARVSASFGAGAAVVYNCTNPPAYNRWGEFLLPMHEAIVAGAAAAGAKLVVMDNLYMYGPTNGAPIREDTPFRTDEAKTRRLTRIAAHRFLMEAHEKGRVRLAIARASDYFGPFASERASFVATATFRAAAAGKAVSFPIAVDQPHTFAYLPDIARGLVTLGERDEALGRVWHLPSPETVTPREFLELVFAAAGQRPRIRVIGPLGLRAIGLVIAEMRGYSEMFYEWREPYAVDASAFTTAFGGAPTPLRQAIAETMAWVRDNPRAGGR